MQLNLRITPARALRPVTSGCDHKINQRSKGATKKNNFNQPTHRNVHMVLEVLSAANAHREKIGKEITATNIWSWGNVPRSGGHNGIRIRHCSVRGKGLTFLLE
jgi:hypothetical protein